MGVGATRFGRRGVDSPPSQLAATGLDPTAPSQPPPAGGASNPQEAAGEEIRLICLAKLDPATVGALPEAALIDGMERLVGEIATERRIQLNGREQRRVAEELVDDMLGLGPLEKLLDDPSVADIMVNGPDCVFVERGGRIGRASIRFRDTAHLTKMCQRIAASMGRHVDEATPLADARLKDGSRVNIVLPPLALDGPYLSIRKFPTSRLDFSAMIEAGSMTLPVANILKIAGRARLNIIVSGGTGSGKTTLLNALSRQIEPGERIVTIEDAAELQLQQPHVVRLETRPPSIEGHGEIDARALLRNALRMRPDRIIVGETRGPEAFDMLQAMNTGHDGSMSTVHANSSRDALTRIENLVQMGNMGLPTTAIRRQIASAVDLIVQIARHRDGRRRITQVSEIAGMEEDVIVLNDIFTLEIAGAAGDGELTTRYRVSRHRPSFIDRLAYFGLDQVWMQAIDAGPANSGYELAFAGIA